MILVVGGTGKVGRHVVTGLVARDESVRVLSRRPDSAGMPAPVEVVAGSPAEPASVAAALEGVDRAFVTIVGDVETQARSVAEGVRVAGGVKRVVLMSSSAVRHPVRHRIADEHRAAEEILRDVAPEVTVLRPGPFHSNALWWAPSIRSAGHVRCSIGNQPGAPIDPADVAAVGIVALLGAGHAGKVHELTGPEVLTSADQTEILSRVLGRPLTFDVAPEEETVARFAAITGDRPAAEGNVRALRSPEVPWRRANSAVAELTGRPARRFEDWAADNAALFR
jgi:uncharacterized protein YbjT (DUF2867 family)